MIVVFNRNSLFSAIALLPFILLLILVDGTAMNGEILRLGLWDLLFDFSNNITGLVLLSSFLFYSAVQVNRLVIIHRMDNNRTVYSGSVYAFLMTCVVGFSSMSEQVVANMFLIMLLGELFSYYNNLHKVSNVINIGIYTGLMFISSPSYAIFILPLLISFRVVKSRSAKDYLQWLFAFFSTLFLFSAVVFFLHKSQAIIPTLKGAFYLFPIEILPSNGYLSLIPYALALLLSIAGLQQLLRKRNIHGLRKLNLLYLFFLFTPLVVVMSSVVNVFDVQVLAPFLAVFMGVLLSDGKSNLIPLIITGLLIIASLYFKVVQIS